jgi:predicted small secreted protein
MSMAIAGPSTGADVCGIENAQLAAPARSFAPAFVTVCVVLCSMLAAGCARNTPQHEVDSVGPEVQSAGPEVKASPVRAAARIHRSSQQSYAKPLIRRPDAALLAPLPAPDCEFNRTNVSAVDPNEWARLKIEYERQCYQDAEKAARDRLSQLQASSTCEIEPPTRRARVAYQQSMQR